MPFASDWDDESPAFWAESENAEKKKKETQLFHLENYSS
jgi:hypothetical protein